MSGDYPSLLEEAVINFLDNRGWEDGGVNDEATSRDGGYYTFVLKGSLAFRLAVLGVFSECQPGLSASQLKLRDIADEQSVHFDETRAWRAQNKRHRRGPERPACANGACCFVTPGDARVLQRHIRTGELTLQSMHIVVSLEYMPFVARTMSVAMHAGKCPALRDLLRGRLGYWLKQSMEITCLWWQPARGRAREITYQTLHYHYDAWYPLAEWLEQGESSITSYWALVFPVRCFTERPVPGVLVQYAELLTDMTALAEFVGKQFTTHGRENMALTLP